MTRIVLFRARNFVIKRECWDVATTLCPVCGRTAYSYRYLASYGHETYSCGTQILDGCAIAAHTLTPYIYPSSMIACASAAPGWHTALYIIIDRSQGQQQMMIQGTLHWSTALTGHVQPLTAAGPRMQPLCCCGSNMLHHAAT